MAEFFKQLPNTVQQVVNSYPASERDIIVNAINNNDDMLLYRLQTDINFAITPDHMELFNLLGRIAENNVELNGYLREQSWTNIQIQIDRTRQDLEDRRIFDGDTDITELSDIEKAMFSLEASLDENLSTFSIKLDELKTEMAEAGRIESENIRKFWDEKVAYLGYDGSIFVDGEIEENRLTEDQLAQTESFQKASAILFEKEYGMSWDEADALDGNVDGVVDTNALDVIGWEYGEVNLGEWGIKYMSEQNNQLTEVVENAINFYTSDEYTTEQKTAYLYASQAFEYSQNDLNSFGRALGYTVADEANLISIGAAVLSLGGSVLASQAAKKAAEKSFMGAMSRTMNSQLSKTALQSATRALATAEGSQGALEGGLSADINQRIEIDARFKSEDDYSVKRVVFATATGAVTDYGAAKAFGFGSEMVANYFSRTFARNIAEASESPNLGNLADIESTITSQQNEPIVPPFENATDGFITTTVPGDVANEPVAPVTHDLGGNSDVKITPIGAAPASRMDPARGTPSFMPGQQTFAAMRPDESTLGRSHPETAANNTTPAQQPQARLGVDPERVAAQRAQQAEQARRQAALRNPQNPETAEPIIRQPVQQQQGFAGIKTKREKASAYALSSTRKEIALTMREMSKAIKDKLNDPDLLKNVDNPTEQAKLVEAEIAKIVNDTMAKLDGMVTQANNKVSKGLIQSDLDKLNETISTYKANKAAILDTHNNTITVRLTDELTRRSIARSQELRSNLRAEAQTLHRDFTTTLDNLVIAEHGPSRSRLLNAQGEVDKIIDGYRDENGNYIPGYLNKIDDLIAKVDTPEFAELEPADKTYIKKFLGRLRNQTDTTKRTSAQQDINNALADTRMQVTPVPASAKKGDFADSRSVKNFHDNISRLVRRYTDKISEAPPAGVSYSDHVQNAYNNLEADVTLLYESLNRMGDPTFGSDYALSPNARTMTFGSYERRINITGDQRDALYVTLNDVLNMGQRFNNTADFPDANAFKDHLQNVANRVNVPSAIWDIHDDLIISSWERKRNKQDASGNFQVGRSNSGQINHLRYKIEEASNLHGTYARQQLMKNEENIGGGLHDVVRQIEYTGNAKYRENMAEKIVTAIETGITNADIIYELNTAVQIADGHKGVDAANPFPEFPSTIEEIKRQLHASGLVKTGKDADGNIIILDKYRESLIRRLETQNDNVWTINPELSDEPWLQIAAGPTIAGNINSTARARRLHAAHSLRKKHIAERYAKDPETAGLSSSGRTARSAMLSRVGRAVWPYFSGRHGDFETLYANIAADPLKYGHAWKDAILKDRPKWNTAARVGTATYRLLGMDLVPAAIRNLPDHLLGGNVQQLKRRNVRYLTHVGSLYFTGLGIEALASDDSALNYHPSALANNTMHFAGATLYNAAAGWAGAPTTTAGWFHGQDAADNGAPNPPVGEDGAVENQPLVDTILTYLNAHTDSITYSDSERFGLGRDYPKALRDLVAVVAADEGFDPANLSTPGSLEAFVDQAQAKLRENTIESEVTAYLLENAENINNYTQKDAALSKLYSNNSINTAVITNKDALLAEFRTAHAEVIAEAAVLVERTAHAKAGLKAWLEENGSDTYKQASEENKQAFIDATVATYVDLTKLDGSTLTDAEYADPSTKVKLEDNETTLGALHAQALAAFDVAPETFTPDDGNENDEDNDGPSWADRLTGAFNDTGAYDALTSQSLGRSVFNAVNYITDGDGDGFGWVVNNPAGRAGMHMISSIAGGLGGAFNGLSGDTKDNLKFAGMGIGAAFLLRFLPGFGWTKNGLVFTTLSIVAGFLIARSVRQGRTEAPGPMTELANAANGLINGGAGDRNSDGGAMLDRLGAVDTEGETGGEAQGSGGFIAAAQATQGIRMQSHAGELPKMIEFDLDEDGEIDITLVDDNQDGMFVAQVADVASGGSFVAPKMIDASKFTTSTNFAPMDNKLGITDAAAGQSITIELIDDAGNENKSVLTINGQIFEMPLIPADELDAYTNELEIQ